MRFFVVEGFVEDTKPVARQLGTVGGSGPTVWSRGWTFFVSRRPRSAIAGRLCWLGALRPSIRFGGSLGRLDWATRRSGHRRPHLEKRAAVADGNSDSPDPRSSIQTLQP
jgi:hypothetical protein